MFRVVLLPKDGPPSQTAPFTLRFAPYLVTSIFPSTVGIHILIENKVHIIGYTGSKFITLNEAKYMWKPNFKDCPCKKCCKIVLALPILCYFVLVTSHKITIKYIEVFDCNLGILRKIKEYKFISKALGKLLKS